MIERQHGELIPICDGCGEPFADAFDRNDFQDMIAAIKDAGWLVRIERREWEHFCPSCVKEMRSDFDEVIL